MFKFLKNIMNKAGYSYLSNRENLICAEVKGNDICEYFEDVQISYDNGFLKSKEFSNRKIINEGLINRKCKIFLRKEKRKNQRVIKNNSSLCFLLSLFSLLEY